MLPSKYGLVGGFEYKVHTEPILNINEIKRSGFDITLEQQIHKHATGDEPYSLNEYSSSLTRTPRKRTQNRNSKKNNNHKRQDKTKKRKVTEKSNYPK